MALTDDERETLQRWARRSRIVLGCAAGKSNKVVAGEEGVWPQAVVKWRQRLLTDRLGRVS